MANWKDVLGDAYTDDLKKAIDAVVGREFVSRADFNATNEAKKALETALKDRDAQLAALQKSTGDAQALQAQIAELQKQNAAQTKQYEADIKQLKIDNAVEAALIAAKAKNVKAAKALLDLTNPELAEDGTVKGLAEQISRLTKDKETGFLFDADDKKSGTFRGVNPDEGGDGKPSGGSKDPKDMTYDELCAYLAENPNVTL